MDNNLEKSLSKQESSLENHPSFEEINRFLSEETSEIRKEKTASVDDNKILEKSTKRDLSFEKIDRFLSDETLEVDNSQRDLYFEKIKRFASENDVSSEKVDSKKVDSNLPSLYPKEKLGSLDYYQFRNQDFIERNPGIKLPDYYLDYGDKYLKRFMSETQSKLSLEGQEFIERVGKGLQTEIEKKIALDPQGFAELERNSNAFREWAYDTHSLVYAREGFRDLPLSDQCHIARTPDFKHIRSWSGIKEAWEVWFTEKGISEEDLSRFSESYPRQLEQPNEKVLKALENYNQRQPENKQIKLQVIDKDRTFWVDEFKTTVTLPKDSTLPKEIFEQWVLRPDRVGIGLETNEEFTKLNTFSSWDKYPSKPQIGDIYQVNIWGPDDGDVMLSDLHQAEYSSYFRFSTLTNNQKGGYGRHPYNGSREYGYEAALNPNDPDSQIVTFYTRGVDQPQGLHRFGVGIVSVKDVGFSKQDKSWSSLMRVIEERVLSEGGKIINKLEGNSRRSLFLEIDP